MINDERILEMLSLVEEWLDRKYGIKETTGLFFGVGYTETIDYALPKTILTLTIIVDPDVYGMKITSIEPVIQMVDTRGNLQTTPKNVIVPPENIQRLINDHANGDNCESLKFYDRTDVRFIDSGGIDVSLFEKAVFIIIDFTTIKINELYQLGE